jgi:hypothetical protein
MTGPSNSEPSNDDPAIRKMREDLAAEGLSGAPQDAPALVGPPQSRPLHAVDPEDAAAILDAAQALEMQGNIAGAKRVRAFVARHAS